MLFIIGYMCNVIVYNGMFDVGKYLLFKLFVIEDFVVKVCSLFDEN